MKLPSGSWSPRPRERRWKRWFFATVGFRGVRDVGQLKLSPGDTMFARSLMATFVLAASALAQCPVNVDSATSQSDPGALVQFDNNTAGSHVYFILKRGGVIMGTSATAEWGVVSNQVVTVLFAKSGVAVQPQAGDNIQAVVVGGGVSNSVAVQ